jgi:hypothetical protein
MRPVGVAPDAPELQIGPRRRAGPGNLASRVGVHSRALSALRVESRCARLRACQREEHGFVSGCLLGSCLS